MPLLITNGFRTETMYVYYIAMECMFLVAQIFILLYCLCITNMPHHLLWTYCNPSFEFATKAKGLQECGPRGSLRITSHTLGSVRKCEGVNPHTPKATPTLGDGVPVDSKNFGERFEGSKLNGLWRSLYHWKSLGT